MSGPMKVTLSPDMQRYTDDLRAYELAQAEWLGLDPSRVYKISEQIDPPREMFDGERLLVSWLSTDQETAARGHQSAPTVSSDGERVEWGATVHLDCMDYREMREAIGERPQFPNPFTPEQLAALRS